MNGMADDDDGRFVVARREASMSSKVDASMQADIPHLRIDLFRSSFLCLLEVRLRMSPCVHLHVQ